MRAACITARPDVGRLSKDLEIRDLPLPQPGKNQVRVRVIASAINIDDVHFAEGTMFGGLPLSPKPSAEKPYVPGTDIAGIVDEVGPGVTSLAAGQPVYGVGNPMKRHGPWAEYCLASAGNLALKPEVWSYAQAAACAVAGAVSVSAVNAAKGVAGKKCIVVGASGGIGTICLQALVAKGARTWAVCSGRNIELVHELGAERAFDYTAAPYGEQVQALGERVDIVFDFVGGRDIEEAAMSVLAPGGKFITVVGPTKFIGEENLGILGALAVFANVGWRIVSTRLRRGPDYIFTGPTTPDFEGIDELLVATGAKPVIDRVVPLESDTMAAAIEHVVSHRAAGKVVIEVGLP